MKSRNLVIAAFVVMVGFGLYLWAGAGCPWFTETWSQNGKDCLLCPDSHGLPPDKKAWSPEQKAVDAAQTNADQLSPDWDYHEEQAQLEQLQRQFPNPVVIESEWWRCEYFSNGMIAAIAKFSGGLIIDKPIFIGTTSLACPSR